MLHHYILLIFQLLQYFHLVLYFLNILMVMLLSSSLGVVLFLLTHFWYIFSVCVQSRLVPSRSLNLQIEDIHNYWLCCFTNPFELGTRVSKCETRVPGSRGLVKQYNQELCIASIQDVSPRGFSRDHSNTSLKYFTHLRSLSSTISTN